MCGIRGAFTINRPTRNAATTTPKSSRANVGWRVMHGRRDYGAAAEAVTAISKNAGQPEENVLDSA